MRAIISGPAWTQVTSSDVVSKNGKIAQLSLTSSGDIPRKPDDFVNANVVAGFAWADLDTGKVFVTTIHTVLGRDSHQNPDSWHAHTVSLSFGDGNPNFCVESIDSTPTAGISISGSNMKVNVGIDKLPFAPEDVDAAVGFVINPSSECTTTGLGVDVVGP